MGALLGFLAIIGIVASLMWRLSRIIRAGRVIGETAKEVANLPRKMKFQNKAGQSDLQLVTDPREAAALLMLAVARAGGEITKAQKDGIINQITAKFELPMDQAEELLTHVAWLSKDLPQANSPVARMSKMVLTQVSTKELIELEDMLMQIARIDGAPNAAQKDIVNQFATRVGI
ncbi:hypothetical protein MNBD_ALPHA06-1270 [hydrothermal vent metagenome]|uniref:Co-chaperone DjlA N-terminal domain-containing protein n=1 Tax=hydrothermal vent metagenome TaxID=652676 RepID=A0A3B0R3Z1_9ZZZZ